MRNRILPAGILLLVLANLMVFAKKKPESVSVVMPEVTARGRMLYECDQAAWHATDAVQATNPAKESVGRYIASKSDAGWVVAFGHLNDTRDKFLVAYEATQGTTLQEFTVKKLDPPRQDASFYLFAARAIDTALHDFRGEKRPYNVAVLPVPPDQQYVYVLPAQTENGVYPLGGEKQETLHNSNRRNHPGRKVVIPSLRASVSPCAFPWQSAEPTANREPGTGNCLGSLLQSAL
jgi:hypothetical protein